MKIGTVLLGTILVGAAVFTAAPISSATVESDVAAPRPVRSAVTTSEFATTAAGGPRTASVHMSVGMQRSTIWAAVRLAMLNDQTDQVVARVTRSPRGSCTIEGHSIRAHRPGRCVVRVLANGKSGRLKIDVDRAPARSVKDRPGGNVLDLKPIYIRFKDSPDRRRDVNGEIATFVQGIADWMAIENPGFTLRVDQTRGVPDVQYLEIDMTIERFLAQWTDGAGPLQEMLAEEGLDSAGWTEPLDYEAMRRQYVGIVEAPRGAYRSPNNNFDGGCGSSTGNPFVLYFVRELDGSECSFESMWPGPGDLGWRGYDAIRLLIDPLNGNPGCNEEINERWTVPLEDRPGTLAPKDDIIRFGYLPGRKLPLRLDPARRFYFRIQKGPFKGSPCTDLAFSPWWIDVASGVPRSDRAKNRSTVDRTDDLRGPQVRVLYVLPADGPDRRWDVDGTLDRAAKTADEWLRAKGGGWVRFDMFKGKLDVGFVRLRESQAELWLNPETGEKCGEELCPDPRWLWRTLDQRGFITPDKIHILVYGGTTGPAFHTEARGCAGAFENGVFMSPVQRQLFGGRMGCLNWTEATVPKTVNSLGLIMIHEIFHTLGAVSPEAPDGGGPETPYHMHVSDPTDLMGGSAGPDVKLDTNRRNYWGHGRTDIVDVSLSPFISRGKLPWKPIAQRVRQGANAEEPWWSEVPNSPDMS